MEEPMTTIAYQNVHKPSTVLVCPKCGNRERFIEVMDEEAHLVDGNLNYIKLVEGIPDHYICVECHETISADSL
jgi:DNA-directed RNA polymerase subunit RPC12/RpoP